MRANVTPVLVQTTLLTDRGEEESVQFYGVPLTSLLTDAVMQCHIYLKMGPELYVLYRNPGLPFDGGVRQRLRESRHTHIFIRNDEGQGLNGYLEENLVAVLASSDIPVKKKAEVLYTTTTQMVRDLLEKPTTSDEIRRAKRVVESSAASIISDSDILSSLIDMISIDYYVYTHSVNVMTYALATGRKLGYKEGEELLQLGQGALFHDIGKKRIDKSIVNKDGPLEPDEFEVMKRHPDYGYETLRETGELKEQSLFIVRHHHEKLDGRGYPEGLKADDLNMDTRIVTCVDIYDALTTRRTYRKAYRSYPALKLMRDGIGEHLDQDVFRHFVLLLGSVV